MAGTPEGKIKAEVRKILSEFSETIKVLSIDDVSYTVTTLKQFWPVPSGYGASDLDVIVCYYGQYIAIETKAPGKKPTPRQCLTAAETFGAGGKVLVIDGVDGLYALRFELESIRANNSKRQA